MRLQTLAVFLPFVATAAASNLTLWALGKAYADGGIYAHKTSDGVFSADIGNFPAQEKFELGLHATGEWSFLVNPVKLARWDGRKLDKFYDKTLYIDSSAGAFAPIGFTDDVSTLKPGQTSFGFVASGLLLLWGPTGKFSETGPPNTGPGGGTFYNGDQGYQWVHTGFQQVYQLYWNQTRWVETVAGRYTLGDASFVIRPTN